VQAYQLAIEQHRNFELRVPANVAVPTSMYSTADVLRRSSSGSAGQPGSMDGMLPLSASGQQQQQQQQQQKAMHGVRGWVEDTAQQQQQGSTDGTKQQPAADSCSHLMSVIAATAAVAERTHPAYPDTQARRRSIGGMRYIRFQFRSIASVGSHMAPAVSVPPALVSMERTNYYWATVDVPTSHGDHPADMQQSGYTFGTTQVHSVSAEAASDLMLVLSRW
jgi:hypothetical protein